MHGGTAVGDSDSKLKLLFNQLQQRGFTNRLHDQITKVSAKLTLLTAAVFLYSPLKRS